MQQERNRGRPEYRAIVTRPLEPTQLGLAGAVQLARIDRKIGKGAKLNFTWLVSSSAQRLAPQQWLALERQRWGIENKTHYPLDVSFQEDSSRIRQPNAVAVLGIFQRIANALHRQWALGKPARQATAKDWIADHIGDRWRTIRLVLHPVLPKKRSQKPARTLALPNQNRL